MHYIRQTYIWYETQYSYPTLFFWLDLTAAPKYRVSSSAVLRRMRAIGMLRRGIIPYMRLVLDERWMLFPITPRDLCDRFPPGCKDT